MKTKRFTLLIALFLLLATSVTAQQTNGHVLTHQPYAPCVGSPVMFNATDTSGQFSQAWLSWSFGDGGYASTNSSNPSVSHIYTSPGTYYVTFFAWDSLTQANDSTYFMLTVDSVCSNHDLITGISYLDANGNGTQDGSEPVLPNTMVTITPGPYTFTTDQSGAYGVNLPSGTYVFTVQPQTYYNVTEPLTGSYTVTSTGTAQTISGNDFGLEPIPGINDLEVTAYSAPPVPGFTRVYYLNYQNVGTSALNASISFQYDPQLTFSSASSGGTNSGNTVTWNLGLLAPGAAGVVTCHLSVSTSQTVGSFLNSIATINPVSGDTTPANNVDSLSQEVLASYDPNDKAASPAGNGPSGDINPGTDLTYTIRFQNTGNFMATNVVLRDTLDADFDLTSFEFVGASHPVNWHLNNYELVFDFANIMLPDSNSNEPASHGWARYKIAHKSALPLGTELTNSASIYFDFNAPILTNTTVNTLSLVISVDDPTSQVELTVAPNPFSEQTMVRFENAGMGPHTFVLRDLQGREVRRIEGIEGNNFLLQRGQLSNGLYLFTLQGAEGKPVTGKVVVQ